MIIHDSMVWEGNKYKLAWHDCDSFDELKNKKLQQSYGVCFCDDKLVITKGSNGQSLVGGHIEIGETPEEALTREVQEEANMKVLMQVPLGYQEVTNSDGTFDYQLRSFCKVTPIGEFISDPAGSVIEIRMINPKDYKKYFNWGKISDRIMKRALKIFNTTT